MKAPLHSREELKALAGELEAFAHLQESIALRAELLRLLSLQPGQRAFDIGCGLGHLAHDMAVSVGHTGQVLGIDIDQPVIFLANSKNSCGWLDFKVQDARNLDTPSNPYDAISCIQVLEYLPDPDIAIAGAFRSLKPGSRAVFCATDWGDLVWLADHATPQTSDLLAAWRGHCRHPRLPCKLKPMLEDAGFEVACSTFVLQNTRFAPTEFSYWLARAVADFAAGHGLLTKADCDTWFDSLRKSSDDWRYHFSLSRSLFLAQKT